MAGPRTKRKRAEVDKNPTSSPPRSRRRSSGGAGDGRTGAEPSGGSSENKTAAGDPTTKTKNEAKTTTTTSTTTGNKSSTSNEALQEVPIPKKKEFQALKTQQQGATTTKATERGGNDHAEGTDSRAQPKASLVEQNKQQEKASGDIMEAAIPKKKAKKESQQSSSGGGSSRATTPTQSAGGEMRSPTSNTTETNKQQQQQSNSAEQSSSSSSSADSAREAKIRNLLEHRKVLLRRVRQGREAARKRLDIIHEKDPTKKHETPEQEIAAFKEMGRAAASMARKHSRHDSSLADGEKRTTSVSLRRGSSVGKRMNAALSSLAPGTAASSSSATSAAAGGGSGATASTAPSAGTVPATKATTTTTSSTAAAVLPADIKLKSQQRPHLPKRPSSTSAIPQKTAAIFASTTTAASSSKAQGSASYVVAGNKTAAAAAAARVTTKKGSSAVQRQQQQLPLTSIAASTQQRPASAAQNLLKKSAASRGGSSVADATAIAPRTAAPIASLNKQQSGRAAAAAAVAAETGSMALPNHRMQPPPPQQQQQQPSVSCPEAAALRERKKDIIRKLTSLLQARCQQQQRRGSDSPLHTSPTNSSSPGRDILSTMGVTAGIVASQQPSPKTEIPPKVLEEAIKGPGEPSRLPRRRKTHWDYLLEEMRWLATDFIEERKWKICTNRVLGESVKTQERVAVASLVRGTSEASKGTNNNDAPDNKDVVAAAGALEVGDATASDASDNNQDERATEIIVRRYAKASTDDLTRVRLVAGMLSSMVSELSTAIESAGVSSSGEADELSKALHRHQLTRKRLETDESAPLNDCAVEKENEKTSKDGDGGEAMDTTSEFTGSDSNKPRDGSEKEKIFRRITDYVDGVLQKVKQPATQLKGANLPGLTTSPTTGQIRAIERIEDSWTRVKSGTVLGGVLASGKTIVSCALIWKNSSDGPQLVICSRSNMIRWMHELGRFKCLKLHPIAVSTGISSPSPTLLTDTDYKASDVVLCDFAALFKLPKETVAGFRSIVLDVRYPRAYFGSRQRVYGEYEKAMTRSFATTEMPFELTSSTWWSQLASTTADSRPNRLLIDSSSPGDTQQFLGNLPDRQLLEVLGLRLAFLLGAKNFFFPGYPLAKCILAWARWKIKNSDEKGTKFQRVRGLLLNLTDSFYYGIEGGKHLEELSLHGSCPLSWDLRMCEMPGLQRLAYDKACRESRASLSATLTPFHAKRICQNDPFVSVANVLICFRRLCIHSNCKALLSKAFVRHEDRCGVWCFQKKFGGGPAQPDVELAASILGGSGKMRELLSILVDECGVEIANSDYLMQFFRKPSRESASKARHKESALDTNRVAVLASLPEAQLLASLLLNSVGIDHEVLFKPELTDAGFGTGSAIHMHPMAWINCQLKLSQFNDDAKTPNLRHGLKRVLIGSLEAVAGDNNGLGIESADVVICLDEDWSGRNELQMMSLGARCLSRSNSSKSDACRFIKLAAADSCEQMFISGGESRQRLDHRGKDGFWPWPLEAKGSFSAPDKVVSDNSEVNDCWAAKEPVRGMFAFPACNILVLRNKELSEVLSPSEPLQPLLNSQSDMLFLPRSNDGSGDIDIEMNLASRLASQEVHSLYKITWPINKECDCTWAFNNVSPPQPLDFPDNLVGRPDLTVLPSRLYLQRLLNDKSAWKLSITSDGTTTAPPMDLMIDGSLPSDAPEEEEQMVADDGLAGKPDELAASLLFYGVDQSTDEVKEKTESARRANSYSSIFSQSKCAPIANDGNSGSEPLVYFPPLFPRLLECSGLARFGVETLRSHVVADSDLRKRRSDGSPLPNAKRPRIEADSNVDGADDSAEKQLLLPQEKSALEPRLITEDEASHNDAASVLFDLSDDFGLAGIGAVPLPRDSALTAANISVQAGQTKRTVSEVGAWFSNTRFPTDAEEVQAAGAQGSLNSELDSMILFVSRKRQMGFSGLPGQPSHHVLSQCFHSWSGGAASGTLSGSFSNLYPDLNGADKKLKKKLANQKESNVGLSAFSRLPLQQMGKVKDMNRNRASVISRYTGMANTLFEAPLFRAASLRVRMSVAERFERHGWTSGTAFEAGPGLPLLVSKQPAAFPPYQGLLQVDPNLWTSLVKRLKTKASSTGDEAIESSKAQKLALRRSLNAPCRVDFGPFQVGFLSSPSGTTAVSPPRPRVGIALPLGVKLPQYKEQIQLDWSPKDNRRLELDVERFGMNWVLAASIMGGFQDIVYYSPHDRPEFDVPRSARSCREHWMSLARAQPSLITELRYPDPGPDEQNDAMEIDEGSQKPDNSRRFSIDNVTGMSMLISGPDSKIELLSPLPIDDNETAKDPVDSSKESQRNATEAPDEPIGKEATPPTNAKPRRTFNAIRSAKAKKQVVPITIPGVGSGSPPAVVPSHLSHMQSVQSSVAAAWTNGRTEMWPLQLLEAADRHQANASATASVTSTSAPSAVAPSASRPQSSSIRASSSKPPPSSKTSSASAAGKRPSSRSSSTFTSAPSSNSVANKVSSSRAPPAASHGSSGRNSSSSSTAAQTFKPPPAKPKPAVAQQPPPPNPPPTTTQLPKTKSKT